MEQNQEHFREAGADKVETTLQETRTNLDAYLPVLSQNDNTTGVAGEYVRKMG